MKNTCKDCKWYKAYYQRRGVCKRNAPIAIGKQHDMDQFPIVLPHGWCGEFKAKEVEKKIHWFDKWLYKSPDISGVDITA